MLGHKEDIPGSGQWRMITDLNDQCWVCQYWKYALVFWNEDIGKENEKFRLGVEEEEIHRVLGKIKLVNKKVIKSNPNRPMLFSDSINWQGRRFFKLSEFLKILDKENKPDYEADIDREEKYFIRENLETFPNVELTNEQKDQILRWRKEKLRVLKKHYKDDLLAETENILKKGLRY